MSRLPLPHSGRACKVGLKVGIVEKRKGKMVPVENITISSVELNGEEPTELTFADLSDWVLWQFPRLREGWLCGAAHPAEPKFGWIPARIQPKQQRVLLFAHGTAPLATPEEAAEWIANFKEP